MQVIKLKTFMDDLSLLEGIKFLINIFTNEFQKLWVTQQQQNFDKFEKFRYEKEKQSLQE